MQLLTRCLNLCKRCFQIAEFLTGCHDLPHCRGCLRRIRALQFQQILIEGLAVFFYIGAMRFLYLIDSSGSDVLVLVDGFIEFAGGVLYGAAQSLLQRLQAFA